MNRGHAPIDAELDTCIIAGPEHRSQVSGWLRCVQGSDTPALPPHFCYCSPSAPTSPSSLLSFSFPCSFRFLFPVSALLLSPERVGVKQSGHTARGSESLWGRDWVCRALLALQECKSMQQLSAMGSTITSQISEELVGTERRKSDLLYPRVPLNSFQNI